MASKSTFTIRVNRVEVITLLIILLIAGGICLSISYTIRCIDGCGPYHNRTSVADLDGDGDLDVVLSNLRHESDNIVWSGATLWINQGGGKFSPRSGDFGGPFTTAGDVDGDGRVDLVRWAYDAIQIHINYGEEDPVRSGFKVFYLIRALKEQSIWSANGSIALGDLNGDGRLDAIIGSCCATLIDIPDDFPNFIPWVWINTPGEKDHAKADGLIFNALGNLPMLPTLGDLDGDGDLDVYAASLPPKGGSYDTADRILLNDGSGTFADSGQRLENPRRVGTAASGSVSLGDLDGDGDLDALVATAKGASLWMNQGGAQEEQTGIFAVSSQRLGRGHVEAVFLADLDADGDLDGLVAGNAGASVWWNDEKYGFRDFGQRLEYTEEHGLAVGDFNNDGYNDVFSAIGENARLWLNLGDGRLRLENQ